MKWRKNPQSVMGKCRSKNLFQCTQKSFQVPAVVHKYDGGEGGGGGGGRKWGFVIPVSSSQKQRSQTKKQRPGAAFL